MKTHGGISVLAFSLVFALVMVFIARRKSVLSGISGALGKRSPSWLNDAGKIESAIRALRTQKPEFVSRMFWLGLGSQLLVVSEVAVVLWSLRLPLHLITVMAIEG
jgi:hypothetical protein